MTTAEQDIRARFERDGRLWFRQAMEEQELQALEAAGNAPCHPGARIGSDDRLFGEVRRSLWAARIARIWPGAIPVRLLSFSKSDVTNWSIPWHQDKVIAVRRRSDVPGFTNWSRKNSVWHCQPPQNFLASMLFVRIHLDDCDEETGAMQIALGSHRLGVVGAESAVEKSARFKVETCRARRGDILVLKMLTLHRSLSSRVAGRRRALRIDFATQTPPAPLEWC